MLKQNSNNILSALNIPHPNIRFTYETEVNFKLVFLDVMMYIDEENIFTTVHRKLTNVYVYVNWCFLAPHSRKQGMFKALVQHAFMICSTADLKDTELEHLENVLIGNETNICPY